MVWMRNSAEWCALGCVLCLLALMVPPAYFGLSGHLFRFHPARRFGVIRPA